MATASDSRSTAERAQPATAKSHNRQSQSSLLVDRTTHRLQDISSKMVNITYGALLSSSDGAVHFEPLGTDIISTLAGQATGEFVRLLPNSEILTVPYSFRSRRHSMGAYLFCFDCFHGELSFFAARSCQLFIKPCSFPALDTCTLVLLDERMPCQCCFYLSSPSGLSPSSGSSSDIV